MQKFFYGAAVLLLALLLFVSGTNAFVPNGVIITTLGTSPSLTGVCTDSVYYYVFYTDSSGAHYAYTKTPLTSSSWKIVSLPASGVISCNNQGVFFAYAVNGNVGFDIISGGTVSPTGKTASFSCNTSGPLTVLSADINSQIASVECSCALYIVSTNGNALAINGNYSCPPFGITTYIYSGFMIVDNRNTGTFAVSVSATQVGSPIGCGCGNGYGFAAVGDNSQIHIFVFNQDVYTNFSTSSQTFSTLKGFTNQNFYAFGPNQMLMYNGLPILTYIPNCGCSPAPVEPYIYYFFLNNNTSISPSSKIFYSSGGSDNIAGYSALSGLYSDVKLAYIVSNTSPQLLKWNSLNAPQQQTQQVFVTITRIITINLPAATNTVVAGVNQFSVYATILWVLAFIITAEWLLHTKTHGSAPEIMYVLVFVAVVIAAGLLAFPLWISIVASLLALMGMVWSGGNNTA
jgi:hypothetical protein